MAAEGGQLLHSSPVWAQASSLQHRQLRPWTPASLVMPKRINGGRWWWLWLWQLRRAQVSLQHRARRSRTLRLGALPGPAQSSHMVHTSAQQHLHGCCWVKSPSSTVCNSVAAHGSCGWTRNCARPWHLFTEPETVPCETALPVADRSEGFYCAGGGRQACLHPGQQEAAAGQQP